ncbi:MAG: ABC transporter permease subunit [Firmicutes bacterium]|nr:ABC transporter permease subunit [Bacillota bacterium]
MKAVFLKELKSYFKGLTGYIFIGLMFLVISFYYIVYTMYYQYADYYYVLDACVGLIMFIFPVLTMRIFSEEMRNKTDQLLLTSPVKTSGIVLGKFLACECIFLIVILLTLIQPLVTIVQFKGTLNSAFTFGGYLAFFLLGTSFIAIGMFISSLTENQLVAAVITIVVFMLLNLTNGLYNIFPSSRYFSLGLLIAGLALLVFLIYRAISDVIISGIVGVVMLLALLATFFIIPTAFDGLVVKIMKEFSVFERFGDIFTGVFELNHVVFFLSVIVFFLFLTYQEVEKKRWS